MTSGHRPNCACKSRQPSARGLIRLRIRRPRHGELGPVQLADAPARTTFATSSATTTRYPLGPPTSSSRQTLSGELGGFDPTSRHLADWDLWIRLAAPSAPPLCDEPLVGYRLHPPSMRSTAGGALRRAGPASTACMGAPALPRRGGSGSTAGSPRANSCRARLAAAVTYPTRRPSLPVAAPTRSARRGSCWRTGMGARLPSGGRRPTARRARSLAASAVPALALPPVRRALAPGHRDHPSRGSVCEFRLRPPST